MSPKREFVAGQTSAGITNSTFHNGVNLEKISSVIKIFTAKSNGRWHEIKLAIHQMLYEECTAKQALLLQQTNNEIGVGNFIFYGICWTIIPGRNLMSDSLPDLIKRVEYKI